MEELLQKHRVEQRNLQERITQKKRNATKKTRKGINDECENLERELRQRQEVELGALTGNAEGTEDQDDLQSDGLDQLIQNSEASKEVSEYSASNGVTIENGISSSINQPRTKKPNRQKARLARRAAEQEAAAATAAEEASQLPDRRADEKKIMEEQLRVRGLVEKEVRSDGHCMYAAVADQLQQNGIKVGSEDVPEYKTVRRDAATFIESHPDDFIPFLEEPLAEYVVKVRDTGEWGGQLELSALSKAYGLTINVLQGDGRVERIEGPESTPSKEVWLAYYRHSFGLGEHYNSLRKAPSG